jgi:hypothetical protein
MSREIVLNYSRNGRTMFDGVLLASDEFDEDQVRSDLQWMQGYIRSQPGGRSLVATIREATPGPDLAGALAKLLTHDGLVNADGLTHAELVAAAEDHITVAETDNQRRKAKAVQNKPEKKPAAKKAKAPAKAAKKPAAKKNGKKDKQHGLGLKD